MHSRKEITIISSTADVAVGFAGSQLFVGRVCNGAYLEHPLISVVGVWDLCNSFLSKSCGMVET